MRTIDILLKQTVANEARSLPFEDVNALALATRYRYVYILKVLDALNSFGRGDLVLWRAIRDAAAADNRVFPKLLKEILDIWLSPEFQGTGTPNSAYDAARKREQFRAAFVRRSENVTASLAYIAGKYAYTWNRLPPPGPESIGLGAD